MKSPTDVRAAGWNAEFELVDEAISAQRWARQRAHRAALHRAASAVPAQARGAVGAITEPEALARFPMMPLTRHAAHRLKGRGITPEQVAMITTFGRPQRVHGATRFALDKQSRQLLAETMPPEYLRKLKSLDILAVVSDDGALITAAHRTERLHRKVTSH